MYRYQPITNNVIIYRYAAVPHSRLASPVPVKRLIKDSDILIHMPAQVPIRGPLKIQNKTDRNHRPISLPSNPINVPLESVQNYPSNFHGIAYHLSSYSTLRTTISLIAYVLGSSLGITTDSSESPAYNPSCSHTCHSIPVSFYDRLYLSAEFPSFLQDNGVFDFAS